jgi:hypothetical protein
MRNEKDVTAELITLSVDISATIQEQLQTGVLPKLCSNVNGWFDGKFNASNLE